MVDKNEPEERISSLKSLSRFMEHLIPALAYFAVAGFMDRLVTFIAKDSYAINLAFKVVQYSFVGLGVLFLLSVVLREAVKIVASFTKR